MALFLSSLFLGGWLAFKISNNKWAITAFVTIFGLCGHIHQFMTIGMETALVIPMIFGCSLAFIYKKPILAAFLIGLTTLCRPEAMFLLPLFVIPCIKDILNKLIKKQIDWINIKKIIIFGGVFGLTILPWSIYCLSISNTFLSYTVSLKSVPFEFNSAITFFINSLFLQWKEFFNPIVLSVTHNSILNSFETIFPMGLLALSSIFFLRDKKYYILPLLFYPLHIIIAGIKHASTSDFNRYMAPDYAIIYLYIAILFGILVGRNYKWFVKIVIISFLIIFGVLLIEDHDYRRTHYSTGNPAECPLL